MDPVKLTIDEQLVQVPPGTTILAAARRLDIFIPVLCHHPDLPPAGGRQAAAAVYQGQRRIENALPEAPDSGCGLCVVHDVGKDDLVRSCATEVQGGMVINTESDHIQAARQEKLVSIMVRHRHACLTCAQQEGCTQTHCPFNVPETERCCFRFGHCELQDITHYIGLPDSTPRWIPTEVAAINDHPLFKRDDTLCIGCTRCVRACCDLRGIGAIGFVHDEQGQVQVGSVAETMATSGCKFCTACVAVCPTGALADKTDEAMTGQDVMVPCTAACPAKIDVPGYLRLIAQGNADEAYAVIREKVPLPAVLGRVCPHPCEQVCRRGAINEPISICALKRYATEGQPNLWKKQNRVAADSGKKAAVVGAGPTGLTAAFYLRKQGHAVSLFDTAGQAGGMLRHGIPEYRLPRAVLDHDINVILDVGVDFRPNQALGQDFSLDELMVDGFDAVLLSVGAQQSRRISIEGCNAPGILGGVEFLRRVAQGKDVNLKDRVAVIGGGNVALDVALTALRCGATDVKMACLEGLDEIPAGPREMEWARAEGVQILPSVWPAKITRHKGQVASMDLVECTGVFDEKGNFCPRFGQKKECLLVDQVIMAVGQTVDLRFLPTNSQVEVNRGLVVVDQETLETGMPAVYAGGDVTRGPATVIHAVAAGRQAAEAIDRALGGTGNIDEVLLAQPDPDMYLGRDDGFAGRSREIMPEIKIDARHNSFQEIATGFSDEQALREARRCLQCDLRLQIGSNPVPPRAWQIFDEVHVKAVPQAEGVFQLLDERRNVLEIKGTVNLRQGLLRALDENDKAALFECEEDNLFAQRENELVQKYLQQHGEMPAGMADDLDELF